MKRLLAIILSIAVAGALSACGNGIVSSEPQPPDAVSSVSAKMEQTDEKMAQDILMEITVTAGEDELHGVLFDNATARAFARRLPMEADLWNPAPGFARAFDLEDQLSFGEERTMDYELGGLAYWEEGPSVAIFYNNDRDKTVVPVVTIGKINDDVSLFSHYDKTVRIEAAEPTEKEEDLPVESVLNASPDPLRKQKFYLWEEGNIPAVTQYTANTGGYSDGPDFRPYITSFPVPENVPVKGAVLICAGGAFQFRSDDNEGTPVAEALAERGYQSFVVDYRLRPYTQQEGALDLARAVRFVRKNAGIYGFHPDNIAVMGFSAGGILAGEMLLNFDGIVSPSVLDPSYAPDDLDLISADAAADGMIYSFYGRLSVGTTDVELLKNGNLPPTFYCYGTEDPFYRQFLANADAAEKAGVSVQRLQLDNMPHGFGTRGGWIETFDQFLTGIF